MFKGGLAYQICYSSSNHRRTKGKSQRRWSPYES